MQTFSVAVLNLLMGWSTLQIGLWLASWLSRLNACQQPLGEASTACYLVRKFLRLSTVYYFWVLLEVDNRLSNLWVDSSCPWVRKTTLHCQAGCWLLAEERNPQATTYLGQVAGRLQHGAGDWESERLRKHVGNILQAGFNIFAALQSSRPLLFVLIAQQISISSFFCLYSKSHPFVITVKEIEAEEQLWEHVCVVQVMLLLLWALIQESPT